MQTLAEQWIQDGVTKALLRLIELDRSRPAKRRRIEEADPETALQCGEIGARPGV